MAYGELSGAGDDHLDRRVQRAQTVEVIEQLLVSEGLSGGPRDRAFRQGFDLGNKSCFDTGLDVRMVALPEVCG